MVEVTMNGLEEMRKLIKEGDVDLLRTMVKRMAEALMDAEVDALFGASHGERHLERVNRRNGYRERNWDTRTGTIELAVPKLRAGSYFSDWLLTPRKRSEQALVAAIADAYQAGVSTRRVDKLVRTPGIEGISKSEVSRLVASLDEVVDAYRSRPLSCVYPFLALDALVVKAREGGRIVSVAAVHAVGVSADLARRDAVHVGLLDDGHEGLLRAAAWLEEARQVAAASQAGDGELDLAGAGLPEALAVAVAVA